MTKASFTFEYVPPPAKIYISRELLHGTLEKVRDQLLRHDINGGDKKLDMDSVCQRHSCGTAACIGGWTSLFILGFEGKTHEERGIVSILFGELQQVGSKHLFNLFYDYSETDDYDEPNVAATAIQRYLDGKKPWPKGKMQNVLPYKRKSRAA